MTKSSQPLKILVVRFSSIGDIVLTTPVLRVLHQQIGAKVHFLGKKPFLSIVEANPYVEKTFGIDRSLNEVWKVLQAEGYDYIIDLHKNLRSRRLLLLRGPRLLTFDKLNLQKWLFTQWKINRLPKLHIVDRYLRAVEPLGVRNDGQGLDYFIPSDQHINPKDLSDTCEAGNYIAWVLGAAHATKRLPLEKVLEIGQRLQRPVVLLGGAAEKAMGEAIVGQWPSAVNACGRLSLHQSASVIEQARLVISPDTGLMHIAAAFHKKILSIWGNTHPDFGMSPYYGQATDANQSFEVQHLPCRPCSKIGYGSCPKGHFRCMQDQDAAAIARAANTR